MKPPFDVRFHDQSELGFKQTTPDDEWLAEVGKRGWVAISHDKRFHRDSAAIAAIRDHKTKVFYMDAGSLSVWHKVQILARCHPRLLQVCSTRPAPFIWHMRETGRVIPVQVRW